MINFSYSGEFDDWCGENGYNWDDFLDEEVLLQKSYSKIIKFYIANENGSYAQVKAYHSECEGLHEIEIQAEGLIRTEEQITITKAVYK